MKALGRAHELLPDDWMCYYLIGEVNRQIGHLQEAIDSFESILADRPSDIVVLMSLGQSYLALGHAEVSDGFLARAEQSFVTSICVALKMIKECPGYRHMAWKTIADAAFSLSIRFSFINTELVNPVLLEVTSLLYAEFGDHLSDIMSLYSLQGNPSLNGIQSLEISIAAYDYRISLGFSEDMASGSAWFDLGIALCSWAAKIPTSEKKHRAENKAIECLTTAIRANPGIDTYWNTLGNANFSRCSKIAQHAYIKALEIDPKVGSTC
jgi:superkiller protein 3